MDRKSFSITRYAIQSFRHYGGKSIVLMIVLASTLVLALLNIMTSVQGTFYQQSVSMGGDAQFKYNNVTPEQIKTVKNQKQVDWTSESVFFRRLYANKKQNLEINSIELLYMENLKQMDGFKIVEGESPQKENEAAIPRVLAEFLGVEAEIGTEFEVTIIRSSVGENGWTTVETPAKFIISGIIQDNSYFETGVELGHNYVMFISKEFVLANTTLSYMITNETDGEQYDTLDLYVKLKKGYEAKIVAEEIADIIGFDRDVQYNSFYLSASLNDRNNRIVFYVIIAFFAVVGALMIYNAFNIVIAKKTRHFGLLTLIGASKKQIRRCVYIEAMLNTAVALPIGLVLGTISSWLAMPIVYSSYANASMVYSINSGSYLLTVLITLIMVMAGALIPAKRAGKITPVEAAKFMPNNKKIRKVKNLKNITLPSLAHVNLFRKKSGVSGIITSLSIVGALVISLSVILFSVYGSIGNLAKQSMAADVSVHQGRISGGYSYIDDFGKLFPPDVIDTIINLNGVKKSKVFYSQYYTAPDIDGYNIASIYGVNDEVMQEIIDNTYQKEGGLSLSDLKENVVNVIAVRSSLNESVKYHVGQDITVNLFSFVDSELEREVTLHVAGVVERNNISPYGIGSGHIENLILPQTSFKANDFESICSNIFLDIDESKHDSITAALDRICESEGNIHYKSYENEKKNLESQMMSILVLVMMALGIVFLVGILNLISTTFIGIEQRKKEFGVLSALGMEHKELKKMLKWEGLWVSVISSTISISGGLAVGGLFYVWIVNLGADYIDLSIPVIPIIIFCLTNIFTPYIISKTAIYRLMKNTTVELMGQEI